MTNTIDITKEDADDFTMTAKFMYPQGYQPGSSSTLTNFGIFRLSSLQQCTQFQKMYWVLSIDRSGSMNDQCTDGKSKIEHIYHTIKNMVNYFISLHTETPLLEQCLTIVGFDHEVETICENERINQQLVDNLPKILNKLIPRGATDFEKVFEDVSDKITKLINSNNKSVSQNYDSKDHSTEDTQSTKELLTEKNNTTQICHIFMSDGHITSGSKLYRELKSKLYPQYKNDKDNKIMPVHAFIGFGSQHDSKLLKELSNIPKGEYFFIDSLENAGMVYGEILYNGLYEYINNLTIRVENGKIYDHEKNTWVHTLYVPCVASGQTRTWHIMRYDSTNVIKESTHEIVEIPTTIHASFDIVSKKVRNVMPEVTMSYPDQTKDEDISIDREVEKYFWRQKTQEKMAKVNKYINMEQNNNMSTILQAKPNYNILAGSLGSYGTPWGDVNTIHTKNDERNNQTIPCKRPKLQHNKRAHNVFLNEQSSTPPSSPTGTIDSTLEEQHQILDMAKNGSWIMVWSMLQKIPSLINSMPFPRRYNLVHHAISQENSTSLRKLLQLGVDINIRTRDGISVDNMIDKTSTTTSNLMKNMVDNYRKTQELNTKQLIDSLSREEYIVELDVFMTELKHYMSEHNLEDDNFMRNLCDDIYVCIKSLTTKSNIGNMYLNTRSASQGKERAYNIQDFGDLEESSQTCKQSFRSLSTHQTSTSTRTAYSNTRASKIMRAVSEGKM